jgi:hypothetical protein
MVLRAPPLPALERPPISDRALVERPRALDEPPPLLVWLRLLSSRDERPPACDPPRLEPSPAR